MAAKEKIRRGVLTGDTSEEFTRKRREERKHFKQERARKEREAIDEKLAEEAKLGLGGMLEDKATSKNHNGHNFGPKPGQISSNPATPLVHDKESTVADMQTAEDDPKLQLEETDISSNTIVDQEHLQLTLEEAFFLVYGLGVLKVQDPSTLQELPVSKLFSICRSNSYFPPQAVNNLLTDDPFLTSYVVYHHFRSLGWVVRPGIKFAVDYLLYNRGPVFSHAEFAVIVLPSYDHSHWRSTVQLRAMVDKKEKKSWWWVHCVNRVQAQVRKSLVIVYVEIPSPGDIEMTLNETGDVVDIGRFLKSYRIREVILKRWTPNRSKG